MSPIYTYGDLYIYIYKRINCWIKEWEMYLQLEIGSTEFKKCEIRLKVCKLIRTVWKRGNWGMVWLKRQSLHSVYIIKKLISFLFRFWKLASKYIFIFVRSWCWICDHTEWNNKEENLQENERLFLVPKMIFANFRFLF